MPVPFKIYADFECLLKGVKSSDKNYGSYTEKYQDHIPCSLAYKLVRVDNKFSKKCVLYRGTNTANRFIEAILIIKKLIVHCNCDYYMTIDYYIKIIKEHFNKNLIISEEERFQLSNCCWICDKLCDVGDDKVGDHCHITGKYRGAAHWSCNINLKTE